MSTIVIERHAFNTAADLVALLERIAGGVVRLDEMYVQDCDGDPLGIAEVTQETLSDNSVVFNVILSVEGDPNS